MDWNSGSITDIVLVLFLPGKNVYFISQILDEYRADMGYPLLADANSKGVAFVGGAHNDSIVHFDVRDLSYTSVPSATGCNTRSAIQISEGRFLCMCSSGSGKYALYVYDFRNGRVNILQDDLRFWGFSIIPGATDAIQYVDAVGDVWQWSATNDEKRRLFHVDVGTDEIWQVEFSPQKTYVAVRHSPHYTENKPESPELYMCRILDAGRREVARFDKVGEIAWLSDEECVLKRFGSNGRMFNIEVMRIEPKNSPTLLYRIPNRRRMLAIPGVGIYTLPEEIQLGKPIAVELHTEGKSTEYVCKPIGKDDALKMIHENAHD